MKRLKGMLLVMVATAALSMSAQAFDIGLTGDVANTSNPGWGSVLLTVDDPFAYDSDTPTSPMPDITSRVVEVMYAYNTVGDAILSYTLTDGVYTAATGGETINLDFYGRELTPIRDDDFDVVLYNGDYSTPVATNAALGIDDVTFHTRGSFTLAEGTQFDRIQIIGHHSNPDPLITKNGFTLAEIRVNTAVAPPPPPPPPAPLVIAYEGFDAVGNIRVRDMVPGYGFTNNADLTNYRYRTYDSAGLSYTDGNGNSLEVEGQYGGMDLQVSGTKNMQLELTGGAISTGTVYMSYLLDVDNGTSGFTAGLLSGAVGASSSMGSVMQAMVRTTSSGWGNFGIPSGIDDVGGPTTAGLHFVVSEVNIDAGTMTTYFDPTDLTDVAGSASHTIASTGATFSPITHFGLTLGSNFGYVDEIRIGNTLESVTPFVPTPAPNMHWNFNDASNSTITEVTSGYDGLASGGTWSEFTPLGAGTSLQFDGIDDAVTVSNYPGEINQDFAISALLRVEGAPGTQRMIYSNYGTTGGFRFYVSADNKWEFATVDSAGTSHVLTGWDALENKWMLVTASFEITSGPDDNGDYTGTGRFFIDNYAVDGKVLTGMKFHPAPQTTTMSIGFDATASTAWFNGRMKDVYFSANRAGSSAASDILAEVLATQPANSLGDRKSPWDHGETELDVSAPLLIPGTAPYKFDWDVSPVVYNFDREREQMGYNPRYFPSKVTFDSANRPYMLGRVQPDISGSKNKDEYFYNHAVSSFTVVNQHTEIQTLDDTGAWRTISVDAILADHGITTRLQSGHHSGGGDQRVQFDAEGDAYLLVHDYSTTYLLYSADDLANWQVYDLNTLAGVINTTASRLVPVRDPANPSQLLANRAPVIMVDAKLVVPVKSGGVLSIPAATELWTSGSRLVSLSIHSGDTAGLVAMGDKVHLVYADMTDYNDDRTHQFAVTWDTTTQTLSTPVYLGGTGYYAGPDSHCMSGIVVDSQGYLHVILGTHISPTLYYKSTNPNDTSSWGPWKTLNKVSSSQFNVHLPDGSTSGGDLVTYIGMVVDSSDTVHLVVRQDSNVKYLHYYRKKATDSEFVDMGRMVYSLRQDYYYTTFYHKVSIDKNDNLMVVCNFFVYGSKSGTLDGAGDDLVDAYVEKWPASYDPAEPKIYDNAHDPVLYRSGDGGDSWTLAQTSDFLQEMSLTYPGWSSLYFNQAEKDAGLADTTNNPDGDLLNNLYEYGLGGDPTDPANQGIPGGYGTMEEDGTNWFTYVHAQRSAPNSGLVYYLETCENLTSESWTNAGYEVVGEGFMNNKFNSVTNRVNVELSNQQFIRLKIEEQ
ncbi:LamG-like jellyroll fold domain-containing protein [Pontiella sulfatireligans]|uniref:LamG-like jellyroll fold domain-containing protein n=1 Tax=Pontiella sulfatireligans TaxID=2750658 RepID=A0A6C2UIS4_9BACT|nr:BNR-4 repeat-containing protein [Pontiella sulfatireligans]VGO19106.1 hypothetical protein SCARR_01162 [Pontiella sulfatireligans]